jgi:DNA invertase Pin-like site-specific DNA recombinase
MSGSARQKLTKRGAKVQFIKEALTFTGEDSAMAALLLSMLGAVAEFEKSLIRERQREGIAIAKAKGNVYKGRKPSLDAGKAAILHERAAAGEPKAKLARKFGIRCAALYVYLKGGIRRCIAFSSLPARSVLAVHPCLEIRKVCRFLVFGFLGFGALVI